MNEPKALKVEGHSIDFVPLGERYGSPARLFTVWFSVNLSVVCAAVGTLAAGYGLPLAWTVAGLAIGNAVGTIFMAAHSAQGPHLGVPQMVQSRAQFGVIGAGLPLVAVVITYTLYSAADGLLVQGAIGDALGIPHSLAMALFSLATLLVAYVGYELIHRMGVALTVLSGLLFAAAAWLLFANASAAAPAAGAVAGAVAGTIAAGTNGLARGFAMPALMLTITQAAAWSLSYGPYVADYSRYLPANVRTSTTFWTTGLGCFLGSTLIMAFGVWLGASFPDRAADPTGAMTDLFGAWRPLARALVVTGVLFGNVMNIYSAYMSTATIFSGLRRMQRIGKGVKFAVMALLVTISTVVAVASQDHFDTYFGDILNAMIYLLAPWSAINLADYYIVRRGRYSIPDLFRREGEYGSWRWHTIAIFLLGVAAQAPFMSLSFYQGWVAQRIGADLAWLPGLLLPAVFYVAVERRVLARRGAIPQAQVAAGSKA
jgi:NCS1 family nucleobase:cation symporter-1